MIKLHTKTVFLKTGCRPDGKSTALPCRAIAVPNNQIISTESCIYQSKQKTFVPFTITEHGCIGINLIKSILNDGLQCFNYLIF